MARAPKANPIPVQTYGLNLPGNGLPQNYYDRIAFADRLTDGVPPRDLLFRRIADELFPRHFEWHTWTNRAVNALCNYRWVGMPGCAGSSKTFNVTSFAVVWWLCDPFNSSVILCSTTSKAMRRRSWAEVQRLFSQTPGERGNFVDSRMIWQCRYGDDKQAIVGVAVEEGSSTKVADNIKGHHTRRQMVVIDEATSVPHAIWDACSNLYSTCFEFILVCMGNPRSRLDDFSRFCEPKDGWNSVSVESEEWETRRQIDGQPGVVVRFDAEKSPNIIEGRRVSHYLPTKERVEARKLAYGGENSAWYWSNERGFWAPEGLTKTVFSESAINIHNGSGKLIFTGRDFEILGAFDPAFGGGDRPALRFAKYGQIHNGKMGIQWLPPIIIPISATNNNPVHFQLAEQVRRQCESFMIDGMEYSCPPENLGIDASGEGGGLCDILQRTWSSKIIRIEFGGAASEDACSLEDISTRQRSVPKQTG